MKVKEDIQIFPNHSSCEFHSKLVVLIRYWNCLKDLLKPSTGSQLLNVCMTSEFLEIDMAVSMEHSLGTSTQKRTSAELPVVKRFLC